MPDQNVPPLKLRMFGPLEVCVQGQPLLRLHLRKCDRLLSLLVLRKGAELERSWVANTLWQNSDGDWPESDENVRTHLRKSLTELRHALGAGAERLQSPTREILRLELDGSDVDLLKFDEAVKRGDVTSLELAVELYKGPLLEGWADDWIFQERQAREQDYLTALERLAQGARAAGNPARVESYLRRTLAVDPLREDALRALMRVLADNGNYSAATLCYHDLCRRLQKENTAATPAVQGEYRPDPETRTVYEEIRAEARRRAAATAAPPTPPDQNPAPRCAAPLTTMPDEDTITFLSTDIEDSSHLWEEHPRAMKAVLARHDTLLCQAIETNGGQVLKTIGDQFCAAFRSAVDGAAAAVAAQQALAAEVWGQERSDAWGGPLRVRMALHTGEAQMRDSDYFGLPLSRVDRLLDLGCGGQILLSLETAELIRDQLPNGAGLVDHGERELPDLRRSEHVFELVLPGSEPGPAPVSADGAAGQLTRAAKPPLAPETGPVDDPDFPSRPSGLGSLPGAARAAARIALLYKRREQPDEELLQLLEQRLTAAGYRVFVDRHLTIGQEWLRAIEEELHTADAVVPLLSKASVQSEMLQYEVEKAYRSARQQQGKPRLLPVRVNYTAPLPPPLDALLGPLHYSLWRSAGDTERVVRELIQALRAPAVIPAWQREPVGGSVPLDSPFYIERRADEQFRIAMARRDGLILVKGARQMGKTSLLVRGLQQAREAGARVLWTDLQMLDTNHFESPDQFLRALAEVIAERLDLGVSPEEVWNSALGANSNFHRHMCQVVLAEGEGPLVWGLDEADRLLGHGLADQVFGMFRALYNERRAEPASPLSRLVVAMAYATEAHLLITDMNQSPFNVGTKLELRDFTIEQVDELNRRHGSPLRDQAELRRFHALLNGQPCLVRGGLQEMATRGMNIDALEIEADQDDGIFADHLRRLQVCLESNGTLREAVRGVLQGEPSLTSDSFYHLRSAGVMAGSSVQEVRPRCELYRRYLERHLLRR